MSSVLRFDEWQDSDGNPVFNGAGGVSPGGLVAVKSAIRDTPEVFSDVAAGANVAVGGLSITHAVADPANRLIISAFLGAGSSTNLTGGVGLAVHDGTGLIAVGDTAGIRTSVTAGGRSAGSNDGRVTAMPSVTLVHTPGAGSKTYTMRIFNVEDGVRTLFVNRTSDASDRQDFVRAVSSIVIQEVAV